MRGAFVGLVVAAAILGMNSAGNVAGAGSATTAATTTAATKTVTITASGCGVHPWCYKPATLTVQRSTKVVWKNMTLVPHDVMPCTKAACKVSPGTGTGTKFASPAINPKKTYAFTFLHPGTYVYYCLWHGYAVMHGTIIVH
jgi:plastocyanin